MTKLLPIKTEKLRGTYDYLFNDGKKVVEVWSYTSDQRMLDIPYDEIEQLGQLMQNKTNVPMFTEADVQVNEG